MIEVIFGCVVALAVSWLMARILPVPDSSGTKGEKSRWIIKGRHASDRPTQRHTTGTDASSRLALVLSSFHAVGFLCVSPLLGNGHRSDCH